MLNSTRTLLRAARLKGVRSVSYETSISQSHFHSERPSQPGSPVLASPGKGPERDMAVSR
jgi:hypothetical protein